jgi:hypothetical protein
MDEWAAKDWWAMLETTPGSKKGKYLRAFLKHPQFPQKLDSLLVIPGLWGGMHIGLLHKLLAMHCDEVRHCPELPRLSLMIYVAANPMLLGLDFEDLSENRGGPSRAPASDGWSYGEVASRAPKISPRDCEFLETNMGSAEERDFGNNSNKSTT